MYSNAESPRSDYGDSLQLTNWILDSSVTYHMTPDISGLIPGSLAETDKYIEVSDGHFITSKQTGEVQIKMRDNNGKHFIATSYNVLLSPDFYNNNNIYIYIYINN